MVSQTFRKKPEPAPRPDSDAWVVVSAKGGVAGVSGPFETFEAAQQSARHLASESKLSPDDFELVEQDYKIWFGNEQRLLWRVQSYATWARPHRAHWAWTVVPLEGITVRSAD